MEKELQNIKQSITDLVGQLISVKNLITGKVKELTVLLNKTYPDCYDYYWRQDYFPISTNFNFLAGFMVKVKRIKIEKMETVKEKFYCEELFLTKGRGFHYPRKSWNISLLQAAKIDENGDIIIDDIFNISKLANHRAIDQELFKQFHAFAKKFLEMNQEFEKLNTKDFSPHRLLREIIPAVYNLTDINNDVEEDIEREFLPLFRYFQFDMPGKLRKWQELQQEFENYLKPLRLLQELEQ